MLLFTLEEDTQEAEGRRGEREEERRGEREEERWGQREER